MKRKNNNKIMFLIILLLAITIGFAMLNTDLSIIGVTGIVKNNWDIHFENVEVVTGSVGNSSSVSIGNTKDIVNTIHKNGGKKASISVHDYAWLKDLYNN